MSRASDDDRHRVPLTKPVSAWAPLGRPVYRMLWATWLTANVCMWMNDVAAAWLMTSLSSAPIMIALVQSAATLPVFLLGVPSGALADIIDRRHYFIATQFWVAAVAIVLCLTALTGVLSAPLLLALTFANGIGLAMRLPVFAALIPGSSPAKSCRMRSRSTALR
jgi:MFS family permease